MLLYKCKQTNKVIKIMQTNKLKNLITTIYYSNNNNKKVIIIKNKKVFKIVKLHNKQTLFNTYKLLYKNNFNNNVTFKKLNTLNTQYYYFVYAYSITNKINLLLLL